MSLSEALLSFQIWIWKEAFILMSLGAHLSSRGLRGADRSLWRGGLAHKATVFIVRASRRAEKVPARRCVENDRLYAMCADGHLKQASLCLAVRATAACG